MPINGLGESDNMNGIESINPSIPPSVPQASQVLVQMSANESINFVDLSETNGLNPSTCECLPRHDH